MILDRVSSEPARMLVWVTLAGFERYFEQVAEAAPAAPDGWPSRETMGALMRESGVLLAGAR